MATIDGMRPLHRRQKSLPSRSIQALRNPTLHTRSPLASPPMVASPIDDMKDKHDLYATSMDSYIINMPPNLDEPLVSFLLRTVFRFPLVFNSIQSSVSMLAADPNMSVFVRTYGEDEAHSLLFIAFLYAMGEDIRAKHPIKAPDHLPRDMRFREAIGILHLAELFDLDSMRKAARKSMKSQMSRIVPLSEFQWVFGEGSVITESLRYRSEVSVKVALTGHFTRLWTHNRAPPEQEQYLQLGLESEEFYMLVKGYMLGHVVEDDGCIQVSRAFISQWMRHVRQKKLNPVALPLINTSIAPATADGREGTDTVEAAAG